jgi:hypothetical protein
LVLSDPDADANDLIRVINESSEDYIYPLGFFYGSLCRVKCSAPCVWPRDLASLSYRGGSKFARMGSREVGNLGSREANSIPRQSLAST